MLDAPTEEDFDVMTRLAVRLPQVPVSYVSIIDKERDFFATQRGLPAPLSVVRQNTGRTFCHYVLESDEPLVVADALEHPVLAMLQSVQAMGARSYVGMPLKLDGQTIGTFCVVDMRPRAWSSSDLEILRQLTTTGCAWRMATALRSRSITRWRRPKPFCTCPAMPSSFSASRKSGASKARRQT